jgi:hypothetical protein
VPGEWYFSILASLYPGLTRVRSILPVSQTSTVPLDYTAIRRLTADLDNHVIPDVKTAGFSSYVDTLITIDNLIATPTRLAGNDTPAVVAGNLSNILPVLTGTYLGEPLSNTTERAVTVTVVNAGNPGTALVKITDSATGALLANNVAVIGSYGTTVKLEANTLYDGLTLAFTSITSAPFQTNDSWTFSYRAAYLTVSVQMYADARIKELQAILDDRDNRNFSADYLSKSFHPCFVNVSVNLKVSSLASVDTAAIQQDIFSYINSIPIGQSLPSSKIDSICHNYTILEVSSIDMSGSIYKPDGTVLMVAGSTLEIPNIPTDIISPNTVAFYVDLDEIVVQAAIISA